MEGGNRYFKLLHTLSDIENKTVLWHLLWAGPDVRFKRQGNQTKEK